MGFCTCVCALLYVWEFLCFCACVFLHMRVCVCVCVCVCVDPDADAAEEPGTGSRDGAGAARRCAGHRRQLHRPGHHAHGQADLSHEETAVVCGPRIPWEQTAATLPLLGDSTVSTRISLCLCLGFMMYFIMEVSYLLGGCTFVCGPNESIVSVCRPQTGKCIFEWACL